MAGATVSNRNRLAVRFGTNRAGDQPGHKDPDPTRERAAHWGCRPSLSVMNEPVLSKLTRRTNGSPGGSLFSIACFG